jgi:hypothetical protein
MDKSLYETVNGVQPLNGLAEKSACAFKFALPKKRNKKATFNFNKWQCFLKIFFSLANKLLARDLQEQTLRYKKGCLKKKDLHF